MKKLAWIGLSAFLLLMFVGWFETKRNGLRACEELTLELLCREHRERRSALIEKLVDSGEHPEYLEELRLPFDGRSYLGIGEEGGGSLESSSPMPFLVMVEYWPGGWCGTGMRKDYYLWFFGWVQRRSPA